MSSGDTKALVEHAVRRFGDEVPALRGLQLVIRLELRVRADVAVWRVQVPGPDVRRDPAGDARLEVSLPRSHFNELAREGRLKDWVDAWERGHVTVAGEPAMVGLIGKVIQRQRARMR